MKLYKRVLKSDAFISLMAGLAATYIRLVFHTSKWQRINEKSPEKYWDTNAPFIYAFWHNRVLIMPCGWRKNTPINMLISKHSDGQLIAKTVKHFNIDTIAGSKSSGGLEALRALLKSLKSGTSVGITPDGPRGPRFEVSDGVIMVAKMSGCPIIPTSYSIKRRKVLGSWDKFIFALPFSRGVFIWGDPIFISKKATEVDIEKAKKDLEKSLCDISNKADLLCGHHPLTKGAAC